MPEVSSAWTTAALSASARPSNKWRLGAPLNAIHTRTATPSAASAPNAGRLLATAGCAASERRRSASSRALSPGRSADLIGMGWARAGSSSARLDMSLMSDRHAHDVFVSGEELVPDLQRGFEADRRPLARQHDRRDVGGFALFVGGGDGRGILLQRIDATECALKCTAEAAIRLSGGVRGP